MTEVVRIPCGTVSCYLLSENGASLLVDTGGRTYRERVLQACKGRDVRLIVLTHGHIDHVQNAAALSARLGAPIAMHRLDAALPAAQESQPLYAHTLPGRILRRLSLRMMRREKLEPFTTTVWLDEGSVLDGFGVEARVLALPGHTDGSIGLLTKDGQLIAGDALMCLPFPAAPLIYRDREQAGRSAARLRGLKGVRVYCGHGAPAVIK